MTRSMDRKSSPILRGRDVFDGIPQQVLKILLSDQPLAQNMFAETI